jgi:energy-coupling factor transport system permease protein
MRHKRRSSYPGQYLAHTGALRWISPAKRLLLAAAISLTALLLPWLMAIFLLALFCAALYAAARLGWRALVQDAFLVALQAPLVLAVYLWSDGRAGLPLALMVSARLALASLPALWVQRTTRIADLSSTLSRILPARLAFVVAMCLHFLPLLARDAREIYLLQRLRGARLGGRELLNPRYWGQACHCLAVPLLMRALQLADQVAVAAMQRGVGSSKTVLPPPKIICEPEVKFDRTPRPGEEYES